MKVLSAPHRPFFLLGIINTLVSIIFFLFSWTKIIDSEISVVTIHPFLMLYTLFPLFIFGFLLTIFPRFLGTNEITSYHLPASVGFISLVFIYSGILYSWTIFVIGIVSLLSTFVIILNLLYSTYITSHLKDKRDTFHILLLHCVGILGLSFYLFGFINDNNMIISLSFWIGAYLYLTLLFFTILQRMIPFFSTSVEGYVSIRPRNIVPSLLLGMVITYVGDHYKCHLLSSVGLCIQAMSLFYLLTQWKLPYEKAPPILMVLYSGLLWFLYTTLFGAIYELALICSAVQLPQLALHHGVYIGFLATIMAGFVSRVTRGHGGENITADAIAKTLFVLLSFIALLRICSDALLNEPMTYIAAIMAALLLWVGGFLVWGIKYAKWLLR